MPVLHLPLSGNVTQSINPWTWFFNPVGSQIGLVNIELGQSSNPAVEEQVLTDVASTASSSAASKTPSPSCSPISARTAS